MLDISTIVFLLALLLIVISFIQPVARRLLLPPNVVLAAVGVAIAAGATFLLYTPLTDAFNDMVSPIVNLPIQSAMIINVFLPPLLFHASLTVDVRRMVSDTAPILVLAIVAVVATTTAIGFGLSLVSTVPLVACLLLGAIVATTDPAAVVAVFRDIGAPARLTGLVEGESLLNDAAAIAIFAMLMEMLTSGQSVSILDGIGFFIGAFAGGILLGLVAGYLLVSLAGLLRDIPLAEFAFTLALPYLLFVVGEHFLQVSGVVAVVVAGLTIAATGRSHFSPESWKHVLAIWDQLGFLAGSMVFILASLLVPKLMVDIGWSDIVNILLVVSLALAGRAVVLFVILPLLSLSRLSATVTTPYKLVILWGGLRGAVTLALALAATENPALGHEVKRFIAVTATGFVLFTLFINGTTLRGLIRLLGLHRLPPLAMAVMDQILGLALAEVRDALKDAGRRYGIAPSAVRSVTRQIDERAAAIGAGHEEAIPEHERMTVGLLALANRERHLVLDHHAQKTSPNSVVERLLRHAGRLLDRARTGGRQGYLRVARHAVDYPMAFKLAHGLHRHLRMDGPLSRQLADRFSYMLVHRLIIDELKIFNRDRLEPLLGAETAAALSEILDGRAAAASKALGALSLQYPDYAEALERRFLRHYGLGRLIEHYRILREEGLLNEELFSHARRSIREAVKGQAPDERLDLGLNTIDMARRLPMFDGLAEAHLLKVCALFHPVFTVPGEPVVRRGDRRTDVYFIASGAVEIHLPDQNVQLGRGDFFGEMALIGHRPRSSDVLSLTYCQLLVLRETDFKAFLTTNPMIRTHVESVIAARLGQDIGDSH
jgi:CPA1 family monovalent cation:H+ antiporter